MVPPELESSGTIDWCSLRRYDNLSRQKMPLGTQAGSGFRFGLQVEDATGHPGSHADHQRLCVRVSDIQCTRDRYTGRRYAEQKRAIARVSDKQGLGRVCFAAHVANTESRQHTCSKTMVTGPVRSQSWHPPVALYVELPVAQPLALRWHPPGGPPSIPMHPPGEEHVLELGTLHECGPHIP